MARRSPKCLAEITVHLPENDHTAFEELALHRGMKPAVLAREIVQEFVKRERDRYRALAAIFSDDE